MPYQVDAEGKFVKDPNLSPAENAEAYREWYADKAKKVTPPVAASTSEVKKENKTFLDRGTMLKPPQRGEILDLTPPTIFNPAAAGRPLVLRPDIIPVAARPAIDPTKAVQLPSLPNFGIFTPPPGGSGPRPFLDPQYKPQQIPPAPVQQTQIPAPISQPTTPVTQPQPESKTPPVGSPAWQQKAAKVAAKNGVLPPLAQPAPPAPAPMPTQPNLMSLAGAALPFITPAGGSSAFPDFSGAGSAVGSTAQPAPAMQLDPANLQNLAGAQTAQGAGASSNPANLMRLAQIGQAMAAPQQPQAMAPQVRPVEMPGRATVRMDGEAEKLLALLLANKQTAMVPGLSRLVRG